MDKQQILKNLKVMRDMPNDVFNHAAYEFLNDAIGYIEQAKTLRGDLKVVRWDGGILERDGIDARWFDGLIVTGCCDQFLNISYKGDNYRLFRGVDYVVTETAIIPLAELVDVGCE